MSAPVPDIAPSPNIGQQMLDGIQDAAIWLGRTVVTCWKEYLLPALQLFLTFLQTGFGIAILSFLVGVSLLTLALGHYEEDDCLNSNWVRIGLSIAAICCFVGAGAALMVGTAILI